MTQLAAVAEKQPDDGAMWRPTRGAERPSISGCSLFPGCPIDSADSPKVQVCSRLQSKRPAWWQLALLCVGGESGEGARRVTAYGIIGHFIRKRPTNLGSVTDGCDLAIWPRGLHGRRLAVSGGQLQHGAGGIETGA